MRIVPVLVVLLAAGCGGPADPERAVRAFLAAAEEEAEAKALTALAGRIDDRYEDTAGRRRADLLRLLAGQFLRHDAIYLFTRIDSVRVDSDAHARVILHAALTGRAVAAADELVALRARVYRFELELRNEGAWRMTRAAWRPAPLEALLGLVADR